MRNLLSVFTAFLLVLSWQAAFAQSGETSEYVFMAGHSTITQTGRVAGVHVYQWTYSIEGQFQLVVDRDTGTASFARVDANAVDESDDRNTLDPNEVFNLTGLTGTVVDDTPIWYEGMTIISFRGMAPDGSDVYITVRLDDDLAHLGGWTMNPPDPADCLLFGLDVIAQRKYSGGIGTADNPYRIATAADLIVLGETPEDYDKHFILTADIDLDPNLPRRKVFDRAVIAPDTDLYESEFDLLPPFQGTSFTGVFDGNGHTISNLTITGKSYLGVFGKSGSEARISNLGLEEVEVNGSGSCVGGLVGWNVDLGSISNCYSTGTVAGDWSVGGLVGLNGGFVMKAGSITHCYSTGTVNGRDIVGGLVGGNEGSITHCYSTGRVNGNDNVGGLVGWSRYPGSVTSSVWDMQTSGLSGSTGGVGLTTAEMMDPDMLGLNGLADDPNWVLDAGHDYPRLAWEGSPGQIITEPEIDWLQGSGTAEAPYRIDTCDQLILLGKAGILSDKHFVLGADIDMDPNLPGGRLFTQAVIPRFTGVFDGNDHTISHLTIEGGSFLGLFGELGSGAIISSLGMEAVDVNGTGYYVGYVGGLVGWNRGSVTHCYSSGSVNGPDSVGGLVGGNDEGSVTHCYSNGSVNGHDSVGGLVGWNNGGASITHCYSTGTVSAAGERVVTNIDIGGLVGWNGGSITHCYSTGTVSATGECVVGNYDVGGLVGLNGGLGLGGGSITNCYSTDAVNGDSSIGGLVGGNEEGSIANCYSTGTINGDRLVGGLVGWKSDLGSTASSFWDIETSGQITSAGGTGRTTVQMQAASTFLNAGWDFIDETANGTEDIWRILEGRDYPRLWWELPADDFEDGEVGLDNFTIDAGAIVQ